MKLYFMLLYSILNYVLSTNVPTTNLWNILLVSTKISHILLILPTLLLQELIPTKPLLSRSTLARVTIKLLSQLLRLVSRIDYLTKSKPVSWKTKDFADSNMEERRYIRHLRDKLFQNVLTAYPYSSSSISFTFKQYDCKCVSNKQNNIKYKFE